MLNCPVCTHSAQFDFTVSDANIHWCPSCDHRFTDPSSVEVAENYSPEYFIEKHARWFTNPMFTYYGLVTSTLREASPAGTSLIDVGCGDGAFMKYFKSRCPTVDCAGTDTVNVVKDKGIEVIEGDFNAINFPKTFDYVITNATIEHIGDVRAFMTKFLSLGGDGAIYSVMTINDASLIYFLARFLKRLRISFAADRIYSAHHLNHFSNTSLEALITQSGNVKIVKKINHDTPFKSLDTPFGAGPLDLFFRVAVKAVFALDRLRGKTYLQTIICQKF